MTGGRTDSMELIRRAQESDQAALGELLERYGDRLLGRIRLMMGDRARRVADSMDFLNGMFVQVIQGLDRFEIRDEQAFLRWATQIARNNIRDGVRKKRETAFLTFSVSSPGEPPGEVDQRSPGSD
ncbi:MAG: sigma factor, partial [Planctomycetota bacterium]